MATEKEESEESVLERIPREVEQALRAITEREPSIESLWVRDDPEPRSWPSVIYGLVDASGFVVEVRVRYFDVNREGFEEDYRCLIDKVPFVRDAADEMSQREPQG